MIDDLSYWHTTDGQVTISSERFKHGTSSLKWEWSSSSSLTYTNPEVFRSIEWSNKRCFALWLFNTQRLKVDENNPQEPLYVEFLTETESEPVARVWYHVNFYGWRPLGLRYALLPQFETNLSRIHGIRFYPPSNLPNGVYYLNGVDFDYKHSVGPTADYQQPWATSENIHRLDDAPSKWLFSTDNIFHNRPWLEQQQVSASDDDVDKLKARWLKRIPYPTW